METVIIGGGIVGTATAAALLEARRRSLVVLEAEDRLAAHQSGNNSGVIHAGLYYRPGSLKARLCAEGREAMYRFCAGRGIAHERCGKVVVAVTRRELDRLEELQRRGCANGLAVQRLSAGELREREPHAAGVAALLVPESGVADFGAVTRALAGEVTRGGGEVVTAARVVAVRRETAGFRLETARGPLRCRTLVNCAGLQADRVAALCGLRPDCRIVPFRGEYRRLAPRAAERVRNLIYPVPDPRLPFLGVHLTRRIDADGRRDTVEAGPSAVLALSRRGYRLRDVSAADVADLVHWPGFWRLGCRWWPTGFAEVHRMVSRRAFAAAARRLVPGLTGDDLLPAFSGVRAMAVDRRGRMLDDFHIVQDDRCVHVLNAPSPAATASLAIGRSIAARVDASA